MISCLPCKEPGREPGYSGRVSSSFQYSHSYPPHMSITYYDLPVVMEKFPTLRISGSALHGEL